MSKSLPVLFMLLLASCGTSPKTNFFTLGVVPSITGNHAAVSSPVQVVAVHLPPSLDRRQMVRMMGEHSVKISDTDRWSASLDVMMRNVLSQDLAARLPDGKVILPAAPPPSGTSMVVVSVAQFGPDATGEVKLSGSWALLAGGSATPTLERDFRLDAGPAVSAGETAAAMSRAVGQLADAIASTLAEG